MPHRILTRLLLAASLAAAACASDGTPATSLDGTIPCGTATCTSGQICKTQASGIDAGAGNAPTCEIVPAGCAVHDCTGTSCGACVLEMCADPNLQDYVRVTGRDLACPAQ